MDVDYIIVGQGICGTFLSYYLMLEGASVLVIDDARPDTASKMASGIINPVTGRRVVRTWMIEELLPFAWDAYSQIGNELGKLLIRQCDILDFHTTQQMHDAFEARANDGDDYLQQPANERQWGSFFNFNFGIGEIAPCWLTDVASLINGWRKVLLAKGDLVEQVFNIADLTITAKGVGYKGINAKKLIFCEGVAGRDNPLFSMLPWSKDKGEFLIASIPGLPTGHIYKHGITIAPYSEDTFWIGASHEWNFTDLSITPAYRQKVEVQLNCFLKLPYAILGHFAAERPVNLERRPFVGLHPLHSAIGIFNGMGTKGCSLAPYFARQFADNLVNGTSILPAADVCRFKGILKKL
jgi:glycine/D-amino acid oxidase-like deaminating enzyme